MADGPSRVDRTKAGHGIVMPPAIDKMPVDWRSGPVVLDPIPSLRMPIAKIFIAAAFDEFEVFRIGNQSGGNLVFVEIDLVTGELVVEAEFIPFITDLIDAGRHRHEPGLSPPPRWR